MALSVAKLWLKDIYLWSRRRRFTNKYITGSTCAVPSRITGSRADGANAQQSDGTHPKEPIRSLAERREQQSSPVDCWFWYVSNNLQYQIFLNSPMLIFFWLLWRFNIIFYSQYISVFLMVVFIINCYFRGYGIRVINKWWESTKLLVGCYKGVHWFIGEYHDLHVSWFNLHFVSLNLHVSCLNLHFSLP